jgi:hypothetical protein
MTDEEETIARLDADLTAFWPQVEASVTGRLFPEAAASIKSQDGPFVKWLNERLPSSEYMIVCDRGNNPPTVIVENKLAVTLWFKLFGKSWTRDLKIEPKTSYLVV